MSAITDSHTLDRICIDGVCHCDWRLTLQNCVESQAMTIIHGINIGISGMAVILGIGLLIHRVIIKGHTFFEYSSTKGCFRPKPIDCMLLFIVIFNFLRLLSSTILIADIAPDMISRSFMFEFPWQFGFGAFALYLIGIAQTLADSHRVIANSWLPSPRLVDFIGGSTFLAPFIMNNPMSLAAGILAQKNLPVAEVLTRILYVFWFIHCGGLSITVSFSGIRLIRILNGHLEKFNTSGPRYASVKTGIFKIRTIMGISIICLSGFAVFLLVFGILREIIIVNKVGSIVLGVLWNFLGAVSTFCCELAILFNPKIDGNTNIGLKTSSNEKTSQAGAGTSYTNFSVQEYSTSATQNTSFNGTLSHNAFDELKQQQLQYQSVFQKHNNHVHQHNVKDPANLDHNIGEVKVSSLGIPLQDFEYENSDMVDEKMAIPSASGHNSIDDDGNSQLDLVGHAGKY